MEKGFVALVGAGPGNPGLFTLRGKELLESAEVVVYDRLVSAEILSMIPRDAKKINVGKESSRHLVAQGDINQILLEEAQAGKRVVRLKGGDPFVFGRGGEELELIVKNGIPFEVVPGITSAISAPSFAGIPVTHRDFCSSFHVITGHQKENEPLKIDFEALVQLQATLVFLMGVASLKTIMDGLMAAGMAKTTPAAIVEKGTLSAQRKVVSTIENLFADADREKIASPSIIIVGKVCTLSADYDWFSKRPLFGRKIIVTRPVDSAGTLTQKLRALGGEVLDFPCIQIEPLPCEQELQKAIEGLSTHRWLVFSSKNAVRIFFQHLHQMGLDSRALGAVQVACVGSQTAAELLLHGVRADFVPETFDGFHLGEGLAARTEARDSLLLIRAENGSVDLPEQLAESGRSFQSVNVYRTVPISGVDEGVKRFLQGGKPVYVTFTSASTVDGFVGSAEGGDWSSITAVCIGKQTEQRAKKYGFSVMTAEKATIDSMVERILADIK